MTFPHILAAAAGGFLVMTLIGLRALVALCSSLPLARHQKKKDPCFDLPRALRRIAAVSALSGAVVAVTTLAVLRFTSAAVTLGYLVGMILAFLVHLPRMSPNDLRNQRHFLRAFADCDSLYRDEDDDLEATRELPVLKKK